LALGNRRSDRGVSTLALFALATVTALAVTVLIPKPKLATDSSGRIPRKSADQLQTFVERWTTTTAEGAP
jgi:hypothetical protein